MPLRQATNEFDTIRLRWIACFAFISLGLPDAVLAVAWPSVSVAVQQPLHHLGWLVSCGFLGYLAATIAASWMVKRLGLAGLLILSSTGMTFVLISLPFASYWYLWLLLASIGGLCGGSIDAAINAFAATRFSPRWLNWMHACWGIGASAGPLAMTFLLANEVSWRVGYGLLASLLGTMTIVLILTRQSWNMTDPHLHNLEPHANTLEALRQPRVLWMCLMYWIYTGIESVAGYLLFSFLTTERHYSIEVAGITTGCYWGSLTLGRIFFGQVSNHFPKESLLKGVAMIAIGSSLLIAFKTPVPTELIGASLLGFSLAPLFPTWIALTPQYVGRRFSHSAIGLQIGSAAIGVATFPLLVGELASQLSLEVAPYFLVFGTTVFLGIQSSTLRAIAKSHS